MLLTSDNVIAPIGRLHSLCKDAMCEPEPLPALHRRDANDPEAGPSCAPSATAKPRVRFAIDRNTVRIRRQEEDQEISSIWLQQDDYLAIRHDNIRTLLAIKEADGCLSQLDANTVCPRGLEVVICKLLFGTNAGNQKKVPKLIVQLYKSQKKLGKVDPMEIRSMYEILSQYDRSRASQTAVQDAMAL